MAPPKISRPSSLETVHAILDGKRDFADMIKNFKIEKLFWVIWVNPIYSQVPFQEEGQTRFDTEEGNVTSESKISRGWL